MRSWRYLVRVRRGATGRAFRARSRGGLLLGCLDAAAELSEQSGPVQVALYLAFDLGWSRGWRLAWSAELPDLPDLLGDELEERMVEMIEALRRAPLDAERTAQQCLADLRSRPNVGRR